MPEEDAATPRIVTASHPSEADLLNLAAGRKAEGLEECRRHLEAGCRLCDVRLSELAELVESVREEQAFNEILEGKNLPALPDFGGNTVAFQPRVPQLDEIYRIAESAEGLAEEVLAAARESDAKLDDALRALYGNPARGFALLYACQKGNALVVQDPLRALELARAVFEEAKSLMDANTEVRLTTPAPRESVQAEAKLLESQAQVQLGYALESRMAAVEARELFRSAGDMGFGMALADYYEGSAASFARDYVVGERLLKKALREFDDFRQDNLMGRAEAALGTLYMQRGDEARSLPYLDHAIEVFDPVEDARFLSASLVNRAMIFFRLGRLDDARASYARALTFARELRSEAHIVAIRSGLAQIDMHRAEYVRALRTFRELARDEREAGWIQQAIFSDLLAAECLGRLGRDSEMVDLLRALRRQRKSSPFAPSAAMEELFAGLDKRELDTDLVAHVRSFLEDEAKGILRGHWPLKIVG